MKINFINLFCFFLLLPLNLLLLFLIIIFNKFINVKFYKIETEKMGHYLFNTLLFFARKKKKIYHEKNKLNLIIPFIDQYINQSNRYLLNYWKKFFFIDTTGIIKYLELTNKKFFKKNLNLIINPYDYDNTLKDLGVKIKFNKIENQKGNDFLKKIGINKNDRFVCLLMRDNRYLKETYPNRDYSYHDYRNVNMKNYIDACKFLTSKNIFVIRMGKYVKDAFKVDDKKIIDYATSEFRSDFLDIFISAKCFFWITSGSGLDVTSIIFKKPVLNINRSPVSYIMAHQNFLCTTKHYFDVNLQKKLSFKEISKRSLDIEINSNILKKNKVELVENSSDEILQATKEFYSSLNNNFEFIDKRNELNEKIKNYIKYDENDFLDVNNKPIKNFQNYPFFSYNFLKQNPYLLK